MKRSLSPLLGERYLNWECLELANIASGSLHLTVRQTVVAELGREAPS